MSRYLPLGDFLKNLTVDNHKFHFEEIERLIGEKLPPSAYQYDAWWSNNESHPLMNEVLKAGWKKSNIDFKNKQVEFTKTISSLNIAMSFDDLVNYLQEMTMFRNYQPVVIKTLVENGGRSPKELVRNVLEAYNQPNPIQSMFYTVLGGLKDNNVIRYEGDNLILNTNGQLSDGESKKLINLCNQRIDEFENISSSKDKIAICWPTDNDDEKIDAFIEVVKQNGKALWGVNWNAPRIKKNDFPIKGYLYHRRKIIAIATIHNITDANSTSQYELTLKPENVDYSNNRYSNYLHIYDLKRCDPFPQSMLQLMDPDKKMPGVVQQRVYVKELQDIKVNSNVWIWSVTAENWEIVKEKKIWVSKIPENIRTRVRPSDKVIFYVLGTGQFQGIFEFDGDWYDATEPVWSDETNSVIYLSQIKLKPVKLGNINVYDIASKLKVFPNPDDKRIVNLVLKGGAGYPSNNGKPISYEDYLTISNAMSVELPNYVLLRYTKNNKGWTDEFGKTYHYGVIANYTKLTRGSKAIWYDRIDGQFVFLGHGTVGMLSEEMYGGDLWAEMENFEEFIPPKKATDVVQGKITKLPSYNIQSSILEINKEIYDEIVSTALTEKTFEDEKLVLPPTSVIDEAKQKIKQELLIDDHVIDQIITSLYSEKHVLLTGPVGTGKTHLAKILSKYVWSEKGGYYPETVTATSDWTTQDVIGGIFPKVTDNEVSYLIQKGCVADTVSKNWLGGKSQSGQRIEPIVEGKRYRGMWLVIDEFNRANIDRAFGQLFTSLEYGTIKIPTTDPNHSFEEIKIPKDYRIIGTLNTFDKHFLFRMSDALKRRFSFIEILPPGYDKKSEELQFVADKALLGLDDLQKELNIKSYKDMQRDEKLINTLDNLYEIMAFVRLSKNLGTALLISMFRFVLINFIMTRDWDKSLDQALTTLLLPQLESLQYWQIDSIMSFVGGRIHELFRRFDVNRRPDTDRYEEELKNLTSYLSKSGKNNNAPSWNAKFRNGDMLKIDTAITDLDPWKNSTRPNLRKFREALGIIKQEKGHFDKTVDETSE